MSVDTIPDLSDGLTPLQRRILHTLARMMRSGRKQWLRSSSLLASLLPGPVPFLEELARAQLDEAAELTLREGTNPHLSAYLELTRLTQPFRTRYPLLIGSGNFGSIDGDPPAEPAFTEIRLSGFGSAVVAGIAPHLLVNGEARAPAGRPVRFLPHNLGEILEATRNLIRDPELSDAELEALVPGPDFPTGGRVLTAPAAVQQIYRQGEGTLLLGSDAKPDPVRSPPAVVVTEIPFGMTKAEFAMRASASLGTGVTEGVFDVLDESDARAVKLVLLLRPGVDAERLAKELRTHPDFVAALRIDMSAAIDGGIQRIPFAALLRAYLRQLTRSVTGARGRAPAREELLAQLDDLAAAHADARRTPPPRLGNSSG